MNNRQMVRKNIDYTRTRWTGIMRNLAPFLYTELVHYHYLYRKLDRERRTGLRKRTLLDIGFGSGFNISRITKRYGIATVGTDIVRETVDLYNQKKIPGSRAVWINPSTRRLPFSDSSMDIVVCSHVLEHVPDDVALLREIRRVLKREGFALINIPINEENIPVPNHVRKYVPVAFLGLLSRNGFTAVESFASDGFSRWVSFLGIRRSLISGLLKKLLIFILSLIPIPLLELVPLKKSQFVCFCRKAGGRSVRPLRKTHR